MAEKPQYLNEKQVAEMTGFSKATLANHRWLGRGIPYIKVGKSVRYSLCAVVAFMESHAVEVDS